MFLHYTRMYHGINPWRERYLRGTCFRYRNEWLFVVLLWCEDGISENIALHWVCLSYFRPLETCKIKLTPLPTPPPLPIFDICVSEPHRTAFSSRLNTTMRSTISVSRKTLIKERLLFIPASLLRLWRWPRWDCSNFLSMLMQSIAICILFPGHCLSYSKCLQNA